MQSVGACKVADLLEMFINALAAIMIDNSSGMFTLYQ